MLPPLSEIDGACIRLLPTVNAPVITDQREHILLILHHDYLSHKLINIYLYYFYSKLSPNIVHRNLNNFVFNPLSHGVAPVLHLNHSYSIETSGNDLQLIHA